MFRVLGLQRRDGEMGKEGRGGQIRGMEGAPLLL